MRRFKLCAFALLMVTACKADYGGLAIEVDGSALPGDDIESTRLRIVRGHAVRVHARPRSLSAETYDDSRRVQLHAASDDVARVYRDPDVWRWVIVGRAVGQTCIEVIIDGAVEECIEITVRAEA